jgi:hypothetical protein
MSSFVIDKKVLKRALRYKNPELIWKFTYTYGVSRRAAEVLLEDLIRFLWLSRRAVHLRKMGHKNIPEIFIIEPTAMIDEMWHLFITYTKEYSRFCDKYFGHYLHHDPPPRQVATAPYSKEKAKTFEQEVFEQVSFVINELDEATAVRWFVSYGKKYSKPKINQMRYKSAKAS